MNNFVAGIWGNLIASLLYDSLKKGKESLAQAIQGDEFSRIVNDAIKILAKELERPGREIGLFLLNGLFTQERVSAEIEKFFVGRSGIDHNVILEELYEVLDRRFYSEKELLETIEKFENTLRDLVARQAGVEIKFLFFDLDTIRSEVADVRHRLAALTDLVEGLAAQSSITVERDATLWVSGDIALGGSTIKKYYFFPTPRQKETPGLESYLGRVVSTKKDEVPTIRLHGSVLGRDQVLDLLAMHDKIDRILVIGESGSGKTWLLRQLLMLYAQQARLREGQEIPVYVKLHYYKAGTTLEGLILDSFKRYGGLDLTRPDLQRLSSNGGLLLLLDGLSEVTDPHSCIDMLSKYFSSQQKHRCWITSRVLRPECYGYLEKKLSIGRDQITRIRRPSGEDIEDYLQTKMEMGLLEERLVARLLEGLQEQGDYEYLARNPMMLSILSTEVAAIGGQPKNIAKGQLFYNHVTRLLEGHDTGPVGPEGIWKGLAWLAFEMQNQQTLRLEREKALKILGESSPGKSGGDRTEHVSKLAGQLFDTLANLWLWDPLAWKGHVEFVNPAMQAFFAACQLKYHLLDIGLYGLDQFLSRPRQRWGEVITFLAGLLEEDEIEQLVLLLSEKYPMLAARCVVEGTPVPSKPLPELIRRLYYDQEERAQQWVLRSLNAIHFTTSGYLF